MDNLSYIAFICIVLALGMILPLLDRRTRRVIFFVIVGVCVCRFVSELNSIILRAFDGDLFYVTTAMTPVTEEIAKALPILYFAIVWPVERRTLVVCSFAVGVGFALLENIVVLMQSIDSVTIGWAFVRGLGAGLVHGICTVAVGYGISYIRVRRKFFLPGTFALLSAAIIFHASYNLLVQSSIRSFAIILPIASYAATIPLLRKNLAQKARQHRR